MRHHQIAQTGVLVSSLALGTTKFGRNGAVKYPTHFELPSDETLTRLISTAIDSGINTLDTAPAYGISEIRIGEIIHQQRQAITLISKAGEHFDQQTQQSQYDFRPQALEKQLEQSLVSLQTDYLDIWLLHSDGNDTQHLNDEVLSLFHRVKREGKVRAIGLSGKTQAGGKIALQEMDCIMMASSLDYQAEDSLFQFAKAQQKSILLKKVFNSGWALNHPDKNKVMEQTFRKLFTQSALSSAIIGTINPKHLKENIDVFNKVESTLSLS